MVLEQPGDQEAVPDLLPPGATHFGGPVGIADQLDDPLRRLIDAVDEVPV